MKTNIIYGNVTLQLESNGCNDATIPTTTGVCCKKEFRQISLTISRVRYCGHDLCAKCRKKTELRVQPIMPLVNEHPSIPRCHAERMIQVSEAEMLHCCSVILLMQAVFLRVLRGRCLAGMDAAIRSRCHVEKDDPIIEDSGEVQFDVPIGWQFPIDMFDVVLSPMGQK